MEIRVNFSIDKRKYVVFIEKGFLKTQVYLFEEQETSQFLKPLPVKVSTSLKEMISYWLIELEIRLKRIHRRVKKRLFQ